jgi:hypothetical protein
VGKEPLDGRALTVVLYLVRGVWGTAEKALPPLLKPPRSAPTIPKSFEIGGLHSGSHQLSKPGNTPQSLVRAKPRESGEANPSVKLLPEPIEEGRGPIGGGEKRVIDVPLKNLASPPNSSM